ncbi:MAG: hypothetical protein O8C58_03095 [Candidatus Methanoperedens sp.]|nr:hypothetical protein [Candidatus Methanoperedens sp.]
MELSPSIEASILQLQKKTNARAVVLLDPVYKTGDASSVAGIKTPDVKISLDTLVEYINDFATSAKKFLSAINLDDISAPRSVYISTAERRIFIFRFFIKDRYKKEFPLYLGLTVKKDINSILEGQEKPWQVPQFIFDEAWKTIKEIQNIYGIYFNIEK